MGRVCVGNWPQGQCSPANYTACEAAGDGYAEQCATGRWDMGACNCCAYTTWFNASALCAPGVVDTVVNMDTYLHAPLNGSLFDAAMRYYADAGCAPEGGGIGKLANTNAGLEFWAVDLRNAQVSTPAKFLDAQNAPFAVIVSNTDEAESSDVTVTYPDGNQVSQTVGPESLHVFNLPSTWGLEGSGVTQSAFRIEATKPIVAHQFNPLHNVDVFSNDGRV